VTGSPPRIGLSTYVEDATWGVWSTQAAVLPTTYVATVAASGGLPVLLPPIVPGDVDDAAAAAVAGIDGLVHVSEIDHRPVALF
jgi:gamma-glutamyl-gamma-aminobutyrate hydrolase PuuD